MTPSDQRAHEEGRETMRKTGQPSSQASPPALKPGPRNDLTDIAGLAVGHATDPIARSGVTLVLLDKLTPAAVDVRGGGPATRETEALRPENLVGGLHALVFSGGSVFGLAAADAVTQALSAAGVGLQVAPGAPPVPLVASACLFDLGAPGEKRFAEGAPYARLGREALAAAQGAVEHQSAGQHAATQPMALGSIGAGRGAVAGSVKGGVGAASLDLGDGVMIAALVAANPVGSPLDAEERCFWAHPWEIDAEFGGVRPDPNAPPVVDPVPAGGKLARLSGGPPGFGANTTIGVVATSADLTRAEAQRLAIMAQDGLARAIRPAHTPFDGDTLFALATGAASLGGNRPAALARLGSAAADCVARAIARGVYAAEAEPDEAPAARARLTRET